MRLLGAAVGVCCGAHLIAAGVLGGGFLAVRTPTAALMVLIVLALAGRLARRVAATRRADACR